MVATYMTAVRSLTVSPAEAALMGMLAGGCRLAFASPEGFAVRGEELRQLGRRLAQLGGTLAQVESDRTAALMAAGAALAGRRAAALVAHAAQATCALAGLDDLSPVLIDLSGRLPLGLAARAVTAPHTVQAAFEASAAAFEQAGTLHGAAVVAGLETEPGELRLEEGTPSAPPPIHHDGPDDPAILLVGAGPGFHACAQARSQLEAEGVEAAHLHLLQLAPFPSAIVAPALTSARRVLVVEPGGPGTLAAQIRSHLGAPAAPFGELPRLAGAPLGAGEIALRAREVMAL